MGFTEEGLLIGKILFPPWTPYAAAGATAVVMTIAAVAIPRPDLPYISAAFIGNSMQYYNDMPRLLEALAGGDGHLQQNSCLHGEASLASILVWGNGMYSKWKTGTARIGNDAYGNAVYDWGACTVPQLLFGTDAALEQRDAEVHADYGEGDDVDDDAGMASYYSENDDYLTYFDGTNPCLRDESYLPFLQEQYAVSPPEFDFVVMNDNTRAPARYDSRQESLQALETFYIPWFLGTGATPVFISTYGYYTPYRDMGGLEDVPTFTSLTYEGYKQYAALLADALPPEQAPRIAPVGWAFLIVWEEKYKVWERLFHIDWIHASPSGTYLQALVVYHTLFGVMPDPSIALRTDTANLWEFARRFQPAEHRRAPYPSLDDARYLYDVAVRVCVYKQKPKTLVLYDNGEAATYTPYDDLFKVDDLY